MPLAAPAALAQETSSAQADALYFARWNINYGEYLLDVGKYLEALEAFQTALEAAPNPQVRAEAALQRASTFAIFLDAYDEARQEYEQILRMGTSEEGRIRAMCACSDPWALCTVVAQPRLKRGRTDSRGNATNSAPRRNAATGRGRPLGPAQRMSPESPL
jgi:tetratricopeptide (TPR) repeat protein